MRLNDPYLLITKLFKKRLSTTESRTMYFPFFSKLLDIYILSNFDAGIYGLTSPKLKEFTNDGYTTYVFLCTVMSKKCIINFFETRKIKNA